MIFGPMAPALLRNDATLILMNYSEVQIQNTYY